MSARGVGQRIAAGSGVLLRGLPKIAWAGEWRETLARWFLFGTTGAIAVTAMALHWWLIPVAVAGWCVLAACIPETEDDEELNEDQDDELEDDEEPEDEELLDVDAFVELLHDVAQGENVHLSAVRARLAAEIPNVDWHGPATTALCEAAGVRVRKGVRVAGAQPAVTTGIHRSDLPSLPHLPGPCPVDVLTSDNNTNNNTNSPATRQPEALVLVPDMMRKARR